MQTIEARAKTKQHRRNLKNAALLSIGLVGTLAVAAVAPNMFQLLEKTGVLARLKYQSKSVLARLKQTGDITFVTMNGVRCVRITPQGKKALKLLQQTSKLAAEKPRKWDRRYRLVIFDIPEKRRKTRSLLRHHMSEVGFLRVQDSVWLYPYKCEEFITLLKANLHIGKAVLYAVVEEIENDKWIRAHFGLPKD